MDPKYNNKGLSGILNYGNTCYMNSAIQSLSHTLELTDYFLSKRFLQNLKENEEDELSNNFSNQWYRLLNGLWEDNCTVSPKSLFNLLKKISKKKKMDLKISEHIQNDIQELFMLILDLIHNSVSYKKNFKQKINSKLEKESIKSWNGFFKDEYSIIIELFYGQLLTQITDKNNNNIFSNSFQPICFFPLPVKHSLETEDITLYNCFDEYFKEEIIENHNIDNDIKTVCKKISIYKFPKIMIIMLNRFSNNTFKIDKLVDFPYDLDMTKYNNNKQLNYELYSICNHYGNCNMGHYTTCCKNNNKWYEFDDNSVKLVSNVEKKNAYCLFYRMND